MSGNPCSLSKVSWGRDDNSSNHHDFQYLENHWKPIIFAQQGPFNKKIKVFIWKTILENEQNRINNLWNTLKIMSFQVVGPVMDNTHFSICICIWKSRPTLQDPKLGGERWSQTCHFRWWDLLCIVITHKGSQTCHFRWNELWITHKGSKTCHFRWWDLLILWIYHTNERKHVISGSATYYG